MAITNSYFNIWMSLFKFVNAITDDFTTFFHDAVKLSPVLQQRIADADKTTTYGYVYVRPLAALPAQDTIVTYHLTDKRISEPGVHVVLKRHMATIHDAFRTQQIPFIDIESYIDEADWTAFMASASLADIETQLLNVPETPYTHNGQDIQFYLTEFGAIEAVEREGSTGLVSQISLQHYAPDNFASLT